MAALCMPVCMDAASAVTAAALGMPTERTTEGENPESGGRTDALRPTLFGKSPVWPFKLDGQTLAAIGGHTEPEAAPKLSPSDSALGMGVKRLDAPGADKSGCHPNDVSVCRASPQEPASISTPSAKPGPIPDMLPIGCDTPPPIKFEAPCMMGYPPESPDADNVRSG